MLATAHQKLVAANARQATSALTEKPREAILGGLQIIAQKVAGDGYVFSATRPKFVRRLGDLTFEITVQSDRNNVAGQRAAIWVHAAIYSRLFSAWAKGHESAWIRPNAPFPLPFFGTQIGDLCNPPGWMEWDFADAAKREMVANDLIATIQEGAYPLFSRFDGNIEQVAELIDRDWPTPEGLLSFLLARNCPTLARSAFETYLSRHPQFIAEFDSLRQKFASEGLPPYRPGTPHDLAAFVVATGYPWTDRRKA